MTDTAPTTTDGRESPWVELRSVAYQTFLYRKMVRAASPDARAGDCVAVYDRRGAMIGRGLYNPRSGIVVRMLSFADAPVDGEFWRAAIERAVSLRTKTLRLDETTDAYRLVHAEGDDLSGLVVDRYADVLAVEAFSFGMWQHVDELLPILHGLAGTRHHVASVDERAAHQEGFHAAEVRSPDLPREVTVVENGVRFRVSFETGHKTGFFCDQRENRRRFAALARGGSVLDVCGYTGGFALYARVLGDAADVTCVDLDEDAVAMARRNANLNQVRIDAVHADAFAYMRQMQTNGRQYDAVVLDPPKLIFGRQEDPEGRQKYFDLNRLAAGLVRPGGVLLTCSCSGAMGRDNFVSLVAGAVRHAGRAMQMLDVTGAGPDHPVSPRCPEGEYLKAAWLRVR